MSEVKRYDMHVCNCSHGPHVDIESTPDGDYVLASDYDNAVAERDELVALVSKLEQDHECEDPEHCRFCVATDNWGPVMGGER
jgi:hypothetical protein